MKKLLSVILLAATVFSCSCGAASSEQTNSDTSAADEQTDAAAQTEAETEPEKVITYSLLSPYGKEPYIDPENADDRDYSPLKKTFKDLESAKAAADKLAQYGYVVYDSEGKSVYNPNTSLMAAKILYQAKINADYMRDNGYTYGDAAVNPALDKTERVVSCDRFVGWVLYDIGVNKKRQPETKGYTLYTTNNLEDMLQAYGFEKITDEKDVRAGDIIFVGNSQNIPVPADWKDYPKHVFICASEGARAYRYDAGSNTRIQSTQPSFEALSSTGEFRFAYRAIED